MWGGGHVNSIKNRSFAYFSFTIVEETVGKRKGRDENREMEHPDWEVERGTDGVMRSENPKGGEE